MKSQVRKMTGQVRTILCVASGLGLNQLSAIGYDRVARLALASYQRAQVAAGWWTESLIPDDMGGAFRGFAKQVDITVLTA